jgi:histidinol-phosphatase (PHP family)
MEAYVQEAAKQGVDIFGFSDHAPMAFDKKYRMRFEQMAEYEVSVQALQQKYQGEIEILLAYEVDYLEGFVDERVVRADVDYLIGSVHFIDKWGFDNPEFIGGYEDRDIDAIWQEYFSAIAAMAKSGHFQIVGHLDLLKVFKYLPKSDMVELAMDALNAIKESGMAIEINSAGFRKPIGEQYPTRSLLKTIHQLEIPITFSSDAHKVEQIGYKRDAVLQLARAVGFKKCAVFRQKKMELINF